MGSSVTATPALIVKASYNGIDDLLARGVGPVGGSTPIPGRSTGDVSKTIRNVRGLHYQEQEQKTQGHHDIH